MASPILIMGTGEPPAALLSEFLLISHRLKCFPPPLSNDRSHSQETASIRRVLSDARLESI
jgi:hypothetical protein